MNVCRITVFAVTLLLCACQTVAETKTEAVMPPPQITRNAMYPCWTGLGLINALIASGMKPVARGLMEMKIDPNQPLVEYWESDENFAVVAIYPKHKYVCAILVGDALDGA